jgi:hypothetical protein
MELLSPEHAGALLACLIIILCLHLILKIGEMFYKNYEKKTELMGKLEPRLMAIERDMNEILKFRKDFNNLFMALKYVAGDKWPEIREKIKQDSLP